MGNTPAIHAPMSEPQGPYRTPSLPKLPPKLRPYAPFALGGLVLAVLVYLLWPSLVPVPLEASDVPPTWLDGITAFPAPEPDLPVATPLAPLLAIDGPETFAVVWPEDESVRLRRGETLSVRFNRPMVARSAVGRPLEVSPIMRLTASFW